MTHHLSRATAHLWIEQPLEMEGKNRKGKTNQLFDTHPPIGERIAILRKLEGLDPDERGPVDETITGVPVDLAKLRRRADRCRHAVRRARPLRVDAASRRRRGRGSRRVGRGRRQRPPATRPAGTTPTRRPSATGTGNSGPPGPPPGTATAGSSTAPRRRPP